MCVFGMLLCHVYRYPEETVHEANEHKPTNELAGSALQHFALKNCVGQKSVSCFQRQKCMAFA